MIAGKKTRGKKVVNEKVLTLWKLAQLHGLSPFSLSPIVNASAQQIYCWFRGDEPKAGSLALIEAAIQNIKASFPDPMVEKEHRGRKGCGLERAVWVKDDPEDPAILAEKKVSAELGTLYGRLMAVARDTEKPVVAKAWPGFAEVVKSLRRHGIKFRI
jgi:hypothetical protein